MKKALSIILALCLVLALAACGGTGDGEGGTGSGGTNTPSGGTNTPSGGSNTPSGGGTPTAGGGTLDVPSVPGSDLGDSGKILVVYYSATEHTQRVAQIIADILSADTFELDPAEPYISEDLDWTDRDSRVSKEHEDEAAQNSVELVNAVPDNWDSYTTVFVGYPNFSKVNTFLPAIKSFTVRGTSGIICRLSLGQRV